MHRRSLLIGAGAAGMVLGTAMGRAYTQIANAPDYSLRIAPLRLELAPGKVIDTFAYNGTVPGPVLRLREGRQVSIDIRNDTDIDDIMRRPRYLVSIARPVSRLKYAATTSRLHIPSDGARIARGVAEPFVAVAKNSISFMSRPRTAMWGAGINGRPKQGLAIWIRLPIVG
jgi:Multicopper oxidase